MLAFEGDSEVRWLEGNFSDYENDRKSGSVRRPTNPTASATSRWSAADFPVAVVPR